MMGALSRFGFPCAAGGVKCSLSYAFSPSLSPVRRGANSRLRWKKVEKIEKIKLLKLLKWSNERSGKAQVVD